MRWRAATAFASVCVSLRARGRPLASLRPVQAQTAAAPDLLAPVCESVPLFLTRFCLIACRSDCRRSGWLDPAHVIGRCRASESVRIGTGRQRLIYQTIQRVGRSQSHLRPSLDQPPAIFADEGQAPVLCLSVRHASGAAKTDLQAFRQRYDHLRLCTFDEGFVGGARRGGRAWPQAIGESCRISSTNKGMEGGRSVSMNYTDPARVTASP